MFSDSLLQKTKNKKQFGSVTASVPCALKKQVICSTVPLRSVNRRSVGEIDHPGHSCVGVSNEAGFPQWLIEAPIKSHASGYSRSLCCGMEMRSDGSMYNLLSHQSDTY